MIIVTGLQTWVYKSVRRREFRETRSLGTGEGRTRIPSGPVLRTLYVSRTSGQQPTALPQTNGCSLARSLARSRWLASFFVPTVTACTPEPWRRTTVWREKCWRRGDFRSPSPGFPSQAPAALVHGSFSIHASTACSGVVLTALGVTTVYPPADSPLLLH